MLLCVTEKMKVMQLTMTNKMSYRVKVKKLKVTMVFGGI